MGIIYRVESARTLIPIKYYLFEFEVHFDLRIFSCNIKRKIGLTYLFLFYKPII